MASVDTLFDDLRINCVGATDAGLRLALYAAMDEFCRTTRAWTSVLEITPVHNTSSYALPVPTGTKILEVVSVAHLSMTVSDAVFDGVNIDVGSSPQGADSSTPLYVTVALTPLFDPSTEPLENWGPDDFFADFQHALFAGTMAKMLSQIAKPYSSAQLAMFHARRFRNFLATTRTYVQRGGVPDGQSWRFPSWA